jgi:hypothetical protein
MSELHLSPRVLALAEQAQREIQGQFAEIDRIA